MKDCNTHGGVGELTSHINDDDGSEVMLEQAGDRSNIDAAGRRTERNIEKLLSQGQN